MQVGLRTSARRHRCTTQAFRANLVVKRLMVKLLRADGGCLGTRRRRRTWKTAISFGELLTGFDPEISEWSNPTKVMFGNPVRGGNLEN